MTPLMLACSKGYLPMVQLLWPLSLPLPPPSDLCDEMQEYPIHAAVSEGHDDVVRFLLDKDPSMIESRVRMRKTESFVG